ncbi:MAG: hypothetical protein QNK37_25620 [Acidobacteriota bacterium]|nr:hypothetical protein [Acidobacteriota bacterium]
MGNIELWKIGAALGVPGLALVMFAVLAYKFNFKFPAVPKAWAGPIVVLFLVLTGAVTLTALILFGPANEQPAEPRDPPQEQHQFEEDDPEERARLNAELQLAREARDKNVPIWESELEELRKAHALGSDESLRRIQQLEHAIAGANNAVTELENRIRSLDRRPH